MLAKEILNINRLSNLISTGTNIKAASKFQRKLRILFIDDDVEMCEVISDCLEYSYNCRIDFASDPFESMLAITEKYYDLIILDWNLEALTGEQTLAESEKGLYFEPNIPSQWDHQKVPVVVFSSMAKEKCQFNETRHFKSVGYISKCQSLNQIVESFGDYVKARSSLQAV